MTLHDVNRLFAYWKRYPPTRDLVAAFVSFKPDQPTATKKYFTPEEFKRLVDATGGRIESLAQLARD